MGRMTFVFRRLLQLVPVAIGTTIVVFFMIHLIPGDPARTILGIHATPRAVALLHQEWGLNRPLISQYWLFMDRLLHGNLGVSLFYGGSALSLILTHLPPTLWLITYSSVLAVLISVPLAMIAASRKDGARDHAVRVVPLIGLGMPQFWLAFLLIYAFAIKFHWFPVSGVGHGLLRPPAVDVPAEPDRGAGARAGSHSQPARQHAQRARRRVRDHRQVQGGSGKAAVPAARAAQRGHPGDHGARHQHRVPDRRHGDHRGGLRHPGPGPAD